MKLDHLVKGLSNPPESKLLVLALLGFSGKFSEFPKDIPATRVNEQQVCNLKNGMVGIQYLVGGWTNPSTHLKNMLVKLDHFPKDRSEKKRCLSCHHLGTDPFLFGGKFIGLFSGATSIFPRGEGGTNLISLSSNPSVKRNEHEVTTASCWAHVIIHSLNLTYP